MLAPRPAVAAEYDLRTCTPFGIAEARSSVGWFFYPNYDAPQPIGSREACPSGLEFVVDSVTYSEGWLGSWVFVRLVDDPLVHVSMTVDGGDTTAGIRYVAGECLGCDGSVELPERLPGSPSETVEFDLPGNLTGFVVNAYCVTASCTAASGLTLRDIRFVARDDVAPSLNGPIPYEPDPSPPRPDVRQTQLGGWNRPTDVSLYFTFTDAGLGVRDASLKLDGGRTLWTHWCDVFLWEGIYFTYTPPCPSATPAHQGLLDLRGTPDGWHELQFEATDVLGNAMSQAARLATDGTPPPLPAAVSVAGENENGWLSQVLTAVNWTNTAEQQESETESGIVAAWYDVDPTTPGAADPVPVRVPGFNQATVPDVPIPGDGEWTVDVWTEDAVGNMSDRRQVPLRLDRSTPDVPVLAISGWLSRQALIDGYVQGWQAPANIAEVESGICGYTSAIDRDPEGVPVPVIDVPGHADGTLLPANLPDGVNFLHVRAISCAGAVSAVATTEVKVDGMPPELEVTPAPSDQWSRASQVLHVTATDATSGVDRIEYSIDGSPPTRIEGPTADIVVSEGVHDVSYAAIDGAGNRSGEHVELKIDTSAPDAWFEPRDGAQPAHVTARVTDVLSGVAAAWLEYRRADASESPDAEWHALGGPVYPDAFDDRGVTVTGRIPDEQLADGIYAVRVVAIDRAGNRVATGRTLPDGEFRLVTLPLRERLTLTALVAPRRLRCWSTAGRRCRPNTTCKRARDRCTIEEFADRRRARTRALIDYGKRVALVGELQDGSGKAIGGAKLRIYAAVKGARLALVNEVVTAADGSYSYGIPDGPIRTFVVRYAGDDMQLPVEATAVLGVRAVVELSIRPRVVRVGQTLTFIGRTTSGSAYIPQGGREVRLEFRNGSRWRPAIGATNTDAQGRFRVPFEFTQKRDRPSRVTFRAVIPAPPDSAWPFATGVSPTRSVTVKP